MTKQKLVRVQLDLVPQIQLDLDQIVEAAGSTRAAVIRDAIHMLRQHILKCQMGYHREYRKSDKPEEVILVESMYDQLKLPYTTK